MKILKYMFLILICTSCSKDIFNPSYPEYEGGVVGMSQAISGRNTLDLQLVDEPWTLPFGAFYGGLDLPTSDIKVEFALKDDWIGDYNKENGTDYQLLPAESYSVSGFSSVIRKGKTTSDPLTIEIESKKLDREKQYMFPITLESANGMKIDSSLKTTWFKVDRIIRKETDVTRKATVSVSDENSNEKENSSKLIDGNHDTKYLTFDFTPDLWMQLEFAEPEVVGAYTFTSGNDAQDRDPKSWILYGSQDQNDWVKLDEQTNIIFGDRKETQRYEFENDVAYQYYRVNVTERFGAGNGLFQLSEWRMISFE